MRLFENAEDAEMTRARIDKAILASPLGGQDYPDFGVIPVTNPSIPFPCPKCGRKVWPTTAAMFFGVCWRCFEIPDSNTSA